MVIDTHLFLKAAVLSHFQGRVRVWELRKQHQGSGRQEPSLSHVWSKGQVSECGRGCIEECGPPLSRIWGDVTGSMVVRLA